MESRVLSTWGWNMLFSLAESGNFLDEFVPVLIITWNVEALTLNLKKRLLEAVFHEKERSGSEAVSGPCWLEREGVVRELKPTLGSSALVV